MNSMGKSKSDENDLCEPSLWSREWVSKEQLMEKCLKHWESAEMEMPKKEKLYTQDMIDKIPLYGKITVTWIMYKKKCDTEEALRTIQQMAEDHPNLEITESGGAIREKL